MRRLKPHVKTVRKRWNKRGKEMTKAGSGLMWSRLVAARRTEAK